MKISKPSAGERIIASARQALAFAEGKDGHRCMAFAQAGLDDFEAGKYEEFTDENLQELFDGVERRGRQRLAAERRS